MLFVLEAFNGGSHKQLVDLLEREYQTKVISLPGKKWHWKMRTGGLLLADQLTEAQSVKDGDTLFATSTFNLCDFLALRPEFFRIRKILYFHENQLNYPTTKEEERDYQFGWNQILSCLVADVVLFNSQWNMNSFLDSLLPFINRSPDKQPKDIRQRIESKCSVLYFPIQRIL